MTDPTAPETPRTEAGRRLAARAKREAWGNWEGIAQFEIPAIEREAGSTDALRAALIGLDDAFQWIRKEYPAALVAMPTEFYRGFEKARAALAASDAGPAGIDVERLAEFFHEEYWAEANEPHWPREQADATDCEVCWSSAAKLYARLSRESDR
jgi:hypothetical protein